MAEGAGRTGDCHRRAPFEEAFRICHARYLHSFPSAYFECSRQSFRQGSCRKALSRRQSSCSQSPARKRHAARRVYEGSKTPATASGNALTIYEIVQLGSHARSLNVVPYMLYTSMARARKRIYPTCTLIFQRSRRSSSAMEAHSNTLAEAFLRPGVPPAPLSMLLRATHELALALAFATEHRVIVRDSQWLACAASVYSITISPVCLLQHADLKPENIMLASDGRAVLCDLGLGRLLVSSRAAYDGRGGEGGA